MNQGIKRILSLKNFKMLMRVIVSLTLMVWLLSKADIGQIAGRLREVNWALLILGVPILHFIAVVLRSLRVKKLLSNFDMEVPIWWLSLVQMKGNFLKALLPGGISGDIYRTFTIARKTGNKYESISTILLEKVFGVASLLLLSLTGLFYGMCGIGYSMFGQLTTPVLLTSVLFMATVITLVTLIQTRVVDRIRLPYRFRSKLKEIGRQFSALFLSSGDILAISILSLLIQVVVVTWYFIISRAVDFNLSFLVLMVTIPLVELLVMLPISIGGIGVREGAFVILLTPFGLSIEDVVSFSLLSLTTFTIVRIFSGLAFLFELDRRVHIVKTSPPKT